jgi:hypothetical protein
MLKSLHLRRNANSAFFPTMVNLVMATAMPFVLCNSKPKYLNDWTRSMVVPLYVNSGATLRCFSNTTTLVLFTLMTNCRSTQNSDKAFICLCNLCGVTALRPHLTHLMARVNQHLTPIRSPFYLKLLSDHIKPNKILYFISKTLF